jgi:hypothetical protein
MSCQTQFANTEQCNRGVKNDAEEQIMRMNKKRILYVKFPKIGAAGQAWHIIVQIPNLQAISFISCLDATAGIPHDDFTMEYSTLLQLLIGLFSGSPANLN